MRRRRRLQTVDYSARTDFVQTVEDLERGHIVDHNGGPLREIGREEDTNTCHFIFIHLFDLSQKAQTHPLT